MKKLILIVMTLVSASCAFATSEFDLEDGEESWGQCYITPENQEEWDEETEKLMAIAECPELEPVFAALDQFAEENNQP